VKAARETVGWLLKDKGEPRYPDGGAPYHGADHGWRPTREEADVFETYREARYRRAELLRADSALADTESAPLTITIIRITKRAR